MAKKATATGKTRGKTANASARKPNRAVATTGAGRRRSADRDDGGMGEAIIKLLQSPLVADLLAVAATAALAALAEHGFSNRGAGANPGGRRAGRAVKEAGKAAAAAMGRRLGNEFEEIRVAAKAAKGSATA